MKDKYQGAFKLGPYTEAEVEHALRVWHTALETRNEQNLHEKGYNHRGECLGFECWGYFIRLESGWWAYVADLCEYSVQVMVGSHGSRQERIAFNRAASEPGEHQLIAPGETRYRLPETNRELAEWKKAKRVESKRRAREQPRLLPKPRSYRKLIQAHGERTHRVSEKQAEKIYFAKYAFR